MSCQMSDMKAARKWEVRAPLRQMSRWERAAARRNLTRSEWTRRALDARADTDLAVGTEPPPPSEEDIAAALEAHGELAGPAGNGLRARLKAAKRAKW